MTKFKLILALVFIGLNVNVFAQNTSAQQSQKQQLEKEIAQLQQQIKENNSKSSSALNELTLIRKQIEVRKSLLAESERNLAQINDTIKKAQQRSRQIGERIDTLTLYYSKLVRSAYKNRDAKLWYVYILASKNFAQASRRYSYLKSLSVQMNLQALKMKSLKSELETELARLDSLRKEASDLRASHQQSLDKLKTEEKRSNTLVSELNRNKTKYQKQLTTKRQQVEKLNKEIEKIIADYIAQSSSKNTASGNKTATPIDYKLAAEFENNKGKLPWPADGPVVEKFGRHRHPVYTSIEMPFNNGVGIGLVKGSKVKAIFGGEVKRIIVMPGYNKCVLVQHGNYFTFYCKLADVSVKVGDKISIDQTIGIVDTIDGQTQLHFQVWKEKTPQDPELWLRKK